VDLLIHRFQTNGPAPTDEPPPCISLIIFLTKFGSTIYVLSCFFILFAPICYCFEIFVDEYYLLNVGENHRRLMPLNLFINYVIRSKLINNMIFV